MSSAEITSESSRWGKKVWKIHKMQKRKKNKKEKEKESRAEEERGRTMKTKWVNIVNIKDDELQRGLMTGFQWMGCVSLEKILCYEMERRMRQCRESSIKRQMNDGETKQWRVRAWLIETKRNSLHALSLSLERTQNLFIMELYCLSHTHTLSFLSISVFLRLPANLFPPAAVSISPAERSPPAPESYTSFCSFSLAALNTMDFNLPLTLLICC